MIRKTSMFSAINYIFKFHNRDECTFTEIFRLFLQGYFRYEYISVRRCDQALKHCRMLCWTVNFTLRKFHTHKKNWYQYITFAKCEIYVWSISINFEGVKSVLKFQMLIISDVWRIGTNSSHVWRIGTSISHMWRIDTSISHTWRIGTNFSHMLNKYKLLPAAYSPRGHFNPG